MKKKELIFSKRLEYSEEFKFSQLPSGLQPDDLIQFYMDEGYQGSVESWEPYCELRVYRIREMTDEEIELHDKKMQKLIEQAREERYRQYLKLSKEFK